MSGTALSVALEGLRAAIRLAGKHAPAQEITETAGEALRRTERLLAAAGEGGGTAQEDELAATPAEVTDRAGRTWRIENYQSPSGPAFSLTLPPELDPQWAAGFTAHFDGHLNYLPNGGGL